MLKFDIYKADKNLSESKIKQVAQMTTFIFMNEGITKYIFDFSKETAAETICNLNMLKAREYLNNEQIILLAESDEEIIGIAVLKKNIKSNFLKTIRIYFPKILPIIINLLKIINFKRAARIYKLLKIDKNPADDYYTLEAIGVKESHQGQGVGKRLLKKAEETASLSKRCKGIYLYTSELKNKEIYEHLGYSVIEKKDSEDITIYHMFKHL